MAKEYEAIHLNHSIPDLSKAFDITASAGTDVWQKPPATHSFNAPIIYKTTTVGGFKSARVSVSADWKHKYDQGGLALIIMGKDVRRWVKTGIEFLNEKVNVSTVATDRWSDWSLNPQRSGSGATIEMENAADGSLWVYIVDDDGQKSPLREVTWWGELEQDVECWIGPYVAKPAPNGETDDLTVHFEDLVIDLK